ncbi:MAG TPA: cytochrome o ubiquinol oxidase subunit III [Stenotrophobium sp.]|jgi:cytochrome o ubiquinol oxidase subunit 3|nr:cytochrome o ubiquinol oxidase subunit III [Stenotrophobium sp.]
MSAAAIETADNAVPQFYVKDEPHAEGGVLLGFWIYLMSDCLIFAVLFACYAVYGHNYAAGPSGAHLFELDWLAVSTAALLLSSITYGFAMLEMARKRKGAVLAWLAITACFGLVFLVLEVNEFTHMVLAGAGPDRSAFLSSFFTLVGTHGLHVTFGLIWMFTLMVQVARSGLTADHQRRLACLSLFWHFLDLVWIGVFSFVYLIGALS